MKLTISHIVKSIESAPCPTDHRRKGYMKIVAYRGDDGLEYRKAFWRKGGWPVVTESGDHKSINSTLMQVG